MEKVLKIVDIEEAGFDAAYWATRTSEERISALERLRSQKVIKNGVRQRFQRVCRVIELKQR